LSRMKATISSESVMLKVCECAIRNSFRESMVSGVA
jgi:hypothetical protein